MALQYRYLFYDWVLSVQLVALSRLHMSQTDIEVADCTCNQCSIEDEHMWVSYHKNEKLFFLQHSTLVKVSKVKVRKITFYFCDNSPTCKPIQIFGRKTAEKILCFSVV